MMANTDWNVMEIGNLPPMLPGEPVPITLPPGIYTIVIQDNDVKTIRKTGENEHVVLIFDTPQSSA
jgi:hypothetical protein